MLPSHVSPFLSYLAKHSNGADDPNRVPNLSDLSKTLDMSVPKLREQLEVARALGFVDVRPGAGIRRLPYSFLPGVRQSLLYAVARNWKHFEAYADLRKKIEAAYWFEAVEQLTDEDITELNALMAQAWSKLQGTPVKIPHEEHRNLHMKIFCHLDNAFVQGLLEAFWDAYEAVGLNLYTHIDYLREVWDYHQTMVDAIASGDLVAGHQAFVEHIDLLYHRSDGAESSSSS
jgi:DNA-binding FadR family transcriptional regulator